MLGVASHLSYYNPIILERRLQNIKASVLNYLQLSPKSQVFYRTMNYIRGDTDILINAVSSFTARRFRHSVKYFEYSTTKINCSLRFILV